MEIPQPNTLGKFVHKGVEQKCVVSRVVPHRGLMWYVTVQAVGEYENGDRIDWIGEDGHHAQTFVRDLTEQHGEIFFNIVLSEAG